MHVTQLAACPCLLASPLLPGCQGVRQVLRAGACALWGWARAGLHLDLELHCQEHRAAAVGISRRSPMLTASYASR
jgi:hypothetical protein